MTKKVILVWFRNDLRIHDNEILFEAVHKGDIVIPVYFFDPRYFKTNAWGFQNTGVLRANFLIETVAKLKDNLQQLGADLLVFQGKPEELLSTLCAKYDVTEVYHHREVAKRETRISELVETALWKEKINLKHFIGHTLYHKEDLPIPIKDIPDSFSAFKKKVEKESFVRPTLPAIQNMVTHPHLETTTLPTLQDLGFTASAIALAETASTVVKGGEDEALMVIDRTLAPDYDDVDDYNLVSPYIANGAVSPAFYYHKIKENNLPAHKKKYERLILRLLWRDYFRFMLKKHPNIFFKNHQPEKDIAASVEKLRALQDREINEPLIEALLHDLFHKGNLTYEHREILAAYLLAELNVNHVAGASFFEEHLVDYAPSSTYGYWLHLAGFGTSTKDNLKMDWKELAKKNYRVRAEAK
ncbi:deoxyribodipyrimidine photo-lyase [Sphingobacterium oryzagri]|uniref:Deoxyribodipyrimidine photo-lyase n=1 Tax=Sphingobacterium oryzagri TaxID=3025669 RepID=A0ABY7WJT8_9SPHI|nr:deoxyribodipyrimidine photo-lyase [Sphingobacterium sp. KACC 22765]WDF69861.1 deoxyribodipyrimidine photo-lyase [Sphingobacterium sp. KACC 22765]